MEDQIKKIIGDIIGIKPDDIASDHSLTDDLGADSLDLLLIVIGVEEALDIDLPDDQAEKIQIVSELIALAQGIKAAA